MADSKELQANKGTQAERLVQLRRDKGMTAEQLAQVIPVTGNVLKIVISCLRFFV